MTHYPVRSQTFAVGDPRDFDGNPYEVAERGMKQIAAVLGIAEGLVEATRTMLRNAELERQIALEGRPSAAAWENGPQARKFDAAVEGVREAHKAFNALAAAAAFDPRERV